MIESIAPETDNLLSVLNISEASNPEYIIDILPHLADFFVYIHLLSN